MNRDDEPVAAPDVLHALPEFPLPAALWPNILATFARRRRRRRAAAAGFGVAATIALALVAYRAGPAAPDAVAGMQHESLVLQHRWRAGAQPASPWPAELRRVDASLQLAYDRGAETAEITALWQRRNDLLRILIASQDDALAVTRL
jgi:hypothetical protein